MYYQLGDKQLDGEYSLLLREVNYIFIVFYFTSRQTFWNLGRQHCHTGDNILSPQILECLARNCRNKYSVIWGDKLLSPVRQYLSPQITEYLSPKSRAKHSEILGDKMLSPVRQCCLPKFQNACLQKLERRDGKILHGFGAPPQMGKVFNNFWGMGWGVGEK